MDGCGELKIEVGLILFACVYVGAMRKLTLEYALRLASNLPNL